ncbi:MAG: AI-2E family transporter [Acidobacteriota bacterium]
MKQQVNQTRWLALLVATALAIYLCWLMLRPFVDVLLWAGVLVIVFYPVHQRLTKRLGRPGLSALISSLLVTIAVVAPLAFVVVALTAEFTKAAQHLPAQISTALDANAPVTGRIIGWLERYVDIQSLRSGQFLIDHLKGMGSAIVGRSIGLLGGAVGVIVKTFFVIFTMYYLFRDGDRLLKALPEFLPLKKEQSKQIFERTRQVINASLYGVVLIAMLQGVLGGLAFWILGLPSPVLWGVVMAFVCMIPVAGSFLVWLPASIYLALTGHWTRASLLTIWGILVISTIDNFIRPKLIGDRTKLHELFVFFAVLGGLRVFGVLGIVLGPVVLAITLALLDTLRHAGTVEEA